MNPRLRAKRLTYILIPILAMIVACTTCGEPPPAQAPQAEVKPTKTPKPTKAAEQAKSKPKTNKKAPVYQEAGDNCLILNFIEAGVEINILKKTKVNGETWYLTDYLGEDKLGWIRASDLDDVGDDTALTSVDAKICITATEAVVEVCSEGWLPSAGCECCGKTKVCSDGSVTGNSPSCKEGDKPEPQDPPPPDVPK